MDPKSFDDAMRKAAHIAANATKAAMQEMAAGNVTDEDDVTGVLVGELNAALRGYIGGFTWGAKILRHRKGVAAEEKAVGADILLHISTRGIGREYDKGVLVQSKKLNRGEMLSKSELGRLQSQCEDMLSHSPASFVFDYSMSGVRATSANKIRKTDARDLYANCELTAFRFFFDFFRCTTGDRDVNANMVESIMATLGKDLAEGGGPIILSLSANEG
jgi:hypothetical protein